MLLLTLLVNALLPEPQLWVLYLVAMLVAAVDGLQRPSWRPSSPGSWPTMSWRPPAP